MSRTGFNRRRCLLRLKLTWRESKLIILIGIIIGITIVIPIILGILIRNHNILNNLLAKHISNSKSNVLIRKQTNAHVLILPPINLTRQN